VVELQISGMQLILSSLPQAVDPQPRVVSYLLMLSHHSRNCFDSLDCDGLSVPLIQDRKKTEFCST